MNEGRKEGGKDAGIVRKERRLGVRRSFLSAQVRWLL